MPAIAAAPSRRERKKNAREAIHAAALSLTEELGLAGVTVEAITERADVAARTFFNHFPTKVHAVLGQDPTLVDRLREGLGSRPADEPPLVALRHVLLEDFLPPDVTADRLLRRFRVVRSEPTLMATLHADSVEAERAMRSAINGRLSPPDDFYAALVVSVAFNATRVALMAWCEQGGHGSYEPFVNTAFDRVANGLVLPAKPRSK